MKTLTKDQKTTLINEDFIYWDISKLVHLNVNDNCKRTKNIEDTKFKELDTWLELKDFAPYQNSYNMNSRPSLAEYDIPLNRYDTMMHILAKQHEEVSGKAYKCTFWNVKAILQTSFLGRHLPPRLKREYMASFFNCQTF